MTETIPDGPEAFLEFLREELRHCSHAHHVSFAAVLGERGLAWAREYADLEPSPGQPSYRYLIKVSSAGEYADLAPPLGQGASMRQILEAVWDHACGQDIAPDRLGEFEADLTEVAVLVDPDRYAASYAWRGIRLLRLTTLCCAPGAGAAAAVEVARASLHMSAGYDMSDWELRDKWDIPDIQAEARLQSKLAQTLRAIPRIGLDTVETLRLDFVT